jgi:archaemetzincin
MRDRTSPPAFAIPDAEARRRALGDTSGLHGTLQRALESADAFEPVRPPGPDDWLANHAERGQSYQEWVRSAPNRPDGRRSTIYLQPIGAFNPDDGPDVRRLERFASAYFAMRVAVLSAEAFVHRHAGARITTRRNPYGGQRQLLTSDILALLREQLPGDAFALIAITMDDLYPEPSWNFVFGQASLRERVAVYSFARYHPRLSGRAAGADWRTLLLRRSCKVLAHEVAHMFGIAHCIYYRCLMNGSNHLAESDARPMHLCPIDLRKLQDAVAFDIIERYRRLRDVCRELAFDDEAHWLDGRLAELANAERA